MASTQYTLNFSDTTKSPNTITVSGTTIGTGKNNYDTSLELVGPGYIGYGQAVAQNFLKLLENFSGPYAPLNAIEGQLWYDTSNPDRKVLRINNGSVTSNRWPSATGIYQQSTDPANEFPGSIKEGDIWVDTNSNQLNIRYSDKWTIVGPSAPATASKTGSEAIVLESNTSTSYPVILNWVNGKVIEIISYNDFIPRTVIDGFTNIKAGANLTTRANARFNGTAEKARSLEISAGVSINASDVMRNKSTTIPQIHTGTFIVESSGGMYVRNATFNQTIRIYNTSSGGFVDYSDSTKPFKIGVGSNSFVQFDPRWNNIGINKAPTSSSPTLDINGAVAVSSTMLVGSTATVNGSLLVGENTTITGTLSVVGTSTLLAPITIGQSAGSGAIISPATTGTYDLGSTTKQFRTIYAAAVGDSATSSTNFYGTFHGVIGNDARLSNRDFKLQGQVTATTVTWNATTDVVFNASLTNSAISAQTTATSITTGATLLVSESNTLKQISKSNFLSDVYPYILAPGMIIPYGNSSAPTGFLLCDGSTHSQSSYPSLSVVIGTAYGSAGSNTFKVPNLQSFVDDDAHPIYYIIKT